MADMSVPPDQWPSSLSIVADLPLTEARRAVLAPKLVAVLRQFRQMEALETLGLELAPQMPESWDRHDQ